MYSFSTVRINRAISGGRAVIRGRVCLEYLTLQPNQYLSTAQRQESLIFLALIKSAPGQEQGEFIPIGRGVIGAEYRAVAALIAHTVHMENFVPPTREFDDHIGPVRAHISTDLTTVLQCRQRFPSQPTVGGERIPFLEIASSRVTWAFSGTLSV